jgi:hypothetical protein
MGSSGAQTSTEFGSHRINFLHPIRAQEFSFCFERFHFPFKNQKNRKPRHTVTLTSGFFRFFCVGSLQIQTEKTEQRKQKKSSGANKSAE